MTINEEQLRKNFAVELEALTLAINGERQHFQEIQKQMKDEETRLKTLNEVYSLNININYNMHVYQ